jgi:hypothetical protein
MIGGVGLRSIEEAFPKRIIHVKDDPASPWLEVDVETAWGEEATPDNAERKFAVWKATQRIYRVDPNTHAVADDDPVMSMEEIRRPVDAPVR